MRIQRPRTRRPLTALKDCEPPQTCITASVRPWVGRTPPSLSGSQSIWLLKTPLMAPCRSGLHQTWPSDHMDKLAQLHDLGVVLGRAVRQRQPARVEQP